jgi:hypothetical protein
MSLDFIYSSLQPPKVNSFDLHILLGKIFETISGAGGVVHLVSWSTNLVRSAYLSFLPLPHILVLSLVLIPSPANQYSLSYTVLLQDRDVRHDRIAFLTRSSAE